MEYELLFFTPAPNEDRVGTIKKELVEIIESSGGKFLGDFTDIGKRKLAYPIKRDTHAFYSWARFTLEGESRYNLPEIARRISLNDQVTRHLIVRADEIGKPISEIPSRPDRERKFLEKSGAEPRKTSIEAKPERKEIKPKADIAELDEKLSEILEETPE